MSAAALSRATPPGGASKPGCVGLAEWQEAQRIRAISIASAVVTVPLTAAGASGRQEPKAISAAASPAETGHCHRMPTPVSPAS